MDLHKTELASLQRLIATQPPRAVLAVLQGTLDILDVHLVPSTSTDIESKIVDAAVLFDCVADVRALVPVLDKDLRAVAMRVERLLDDIESGIADELRTPAA
jgi:hypothetical protein